MDSKQLRTEETVPKLLTGSEIESELELDYLLSIIIQMSKELLGADAGGVYLFNEHEQTLELEFPSEQKSLLFPRKLGLKESLVGKVLQTQQPLAVANYAEWTGRSSFLRDYSTQNILSIPLATSAGIIGILSLTYHDEEKYFSDAIMARAKAFGQIAALMMTVLAKGQIAKQVKELHRPLDALEIEEILKPVEEEQPDVKGNYGREEKLAAFHRLEGMLKTDGPLPTDEELKDDYINYLSEKYS